MNELVKVIEQNGNQWVNARDLHAALGVGRDFSNWIKGRIEKYGFEPGEDWFRDSEGVFAKTGESQDENLIVAKTGENQDENLIVAKTGDYSVADNEEGIVSRIGTNSGSENGIVPQTGDYSRKGQVRGNPDFVPMDYWLSLDTAKEIAVVENNERGRQIRRYLIKVEKAWNTPELVIARARQAGAVILDEQAVAKLENLAVGMMIEPFPGSLDVGRPAVVWRWRTEKGGRYYILGYPGKRSKRIILAYAPDGRCVQVNMAREDSLGQLTPGVMEDMERRNMQTLGQHSSGLERAEYDDYFRWRVSLIKDAAARLGLSGPEAAPELPEPKVPSNVLPFKKDAPYYEDDDDDAGVPGGF